MAKNKFAKTLFGVKVDDGTIITYESVEEIDDDFANEPVAVYQLLAVGKFAVKKTAEVKLIKESSLDVCRACGHTRAWHAEHRPRHIFKKK